MTRQLFEEVKVGDITISNRIAMSPMTRNRADENGDPNDLMVEYYRQRNSYGLIITEGTTPSQLAKAYPLIPGIFTDSQIAGWKKVTDAVHSGPAKIFMQLMHAGRIGHVLTSGLQPHGPSAIKPVGEVVTPSGSHAFEVPREMDDADIYAAKESYVIAARNAIEAGFDGVELHGANGYLLHQFLADNSNQRLDHYGGTPENRIRFVVEVVTQVADAIGTGRLGIRISPNGSFNDIRESDVEVTYALLLKELSRLGLAYLHVADQSGFDGIGFCHNLWDGILIANSGYGDKDKVATSKRLIEDGTADIFSFGRVALANPDLPRRLREGLGLNLTDSKTFYTGQAHGYTDYPTLK